jgi:hypothetical protein
VQFVSVILPFIVNVSHACIASSSNFQMIGVMLCESYHTRCKIREFHLGNPLCIFLD